MKAISTRIRERLELHAAIMDIDQDPDLVLMREAADVLEFFGRVVHQLLDDPEVAA
jgi:hypothetical protein